MEEDLTATQVVKGSIYLTLQNVFSTLIAVLGFAFMARMITENEMGFIAGVTFLTSLVQLASDFGLSSSISKHVSEPRPKAEDISSVVASEIAFRTPARILPLSPLFIFTSNMSTVLFKTAKQKPFFYSASFQLSPAQCCYFGLYSRAVRSRNNEGHKHCIEL